MTMPTKKRFAIAAELANGIRSTIQSASTNQGQLHYDMMALDVIEPDPKNPRKLAINRSEILHGLHNTKDPDYQTKLREREALNELATSIQQIGIRNAIEVYKDGSKYRIITGERRYWAALLAHQKSIPVRILHKPDDFHLRYTQWVENINRQDLSLWEKMNNLRLIAEAYTNTKRGEFTEQVLQELLGISNIQAYRYFCLLKADEKIIRLIHLGRLNNLKLVQELVSMKDKSVRNQVISWILSTKNDVTSLSNYRALTNKKITTKQKISQSVCLNTVASPNTTKQLFELVLSHEQLNKYRHVFKDIDWHSTRAITKAFNNLFEIIEKEYPMHAFS